MKRYFTYFALMFLTMSVCLPFSLVSQTFGKWIELFPKYQYVSVDADFTSSNIGWVITNTNLILKTSSSGSTWTEQLRYAKSTLHFVSA